MMSLAMSKLEISNYGILILFTFINLKGDNGKNNYLK